MGRTFRRWRIRLHLVFACVAGLVLFGYTVTHGIDRADSFYETEIASAGVLAVLGGYSGYRALKRGHPSQRIAAMVAMALILCSVAVLAFLNHSPDPIDAARPKPSTVE